MTSKTPSPAPGARSVRHWLSGAALLALVGAACAPVPVPAPGPDPAPPPPRVGEPRVPPPAPGLPRSEPTLRVGVRVDTTMVTITPVGPARLTGGGVDRSVPAGETLRVSGVAGGVRVVDGQGRELAAGAGPFTLSPTADGMLRVGESPYRGVLELRSPRAQRLTVVNVVEMEEYLRGVLPHELGQIGADLLEAGKAQAVAARTYAIAHRGRRSALGFDVYATVMDQVYGGAARESAVTDQAVRETAGEVILYDGMPVEAYYHSTCSGLTTGIHEVWPSSPRPYLVSVRDVDPSGRPYDHFSNRFTWTQRWTAAELTSILNRTLADSLPAGVRDIGTIRDIRVVERTPSERIATLVLETSNGTFRLGRDRIRWIFLTQAGAILNSARFDVELTRDAGGRVTHVEAHGMGWGHGIGMCQVGAMGRARAGQDHRTILQTYYQGAYVYRLY
jgi:stage II sporulation protein D